MIRTNAEVDSRQIPEALERQAAGGKQRQGEGKLGYNQDSARVASCTSSASSAAQLKHFVEIEARCLPRRG